MIRTNTPRFGAMRSFRLVSLLAIGLVAITTSPALASGTWNTTGSMKTARLHHTATLLPNGEVLVAGGGNTKGYLARAFLI
jgi:Galactose oxidase, central domain